MRVDRSNQVRITIELSEVEARSLKNSLDFHEVSDHCPDAQRELHRRDVTELTLRLHEALG